jgi:predicted O-linked N-acetylglucosamine transferase (SPINDLY family)
MSSPSDPSAQLQRALSLHRSGRLDKAIALYRDLAKRVPEHPHLLFLLGSAESQKGNAAEGVRLLERCLIADPLNANAYNNLGLALEGLQRRDDALQAFERASTLQPGNPEAHVNKGLLLQRVGRFEAALASFDRALTIRPDDAEQHNNRGNVLLDLHRVEDALASFDRAIELKPDYAVAFANRAEVLKMLARSQEALESVERAISLNPALAEAHNARGDLMLAARREVEARESYMRAYALNPKLPYLHPRLLYARLRTCDWKDIGAQITKFETAVLRGEQLCIPFDALGLTGLPEVQRKVAEMYTQARHPAASALGPIAVRAREDRIRIGYYSADFRDHATMRLMAELFELHDRRRFELVGFDFGPRSDDFMHRRVTASFDRFIDIRGMSDREAARLSRELGIDIAIDLKGHTEDARPGIFAERAAPVQASYLGYPGTMGAEYIDYLIADHIVVPDGSRALYAEKVVRLPGSYQVNDRHRTISERTFTRSELGLPADAFVFCCFNNSYKITPRTFDVWTRILRRTEGSVLWLIEDSSIAATNLRREAEARGIHPGRLVFAARTGLSEHLARHRNADLFLDTLPYNAHTTASDALWAGLPVLTLAGTAFASRVAASLLAAAGLPDLITTSSLQFEARAIELATDRAKHEEVRARLASNLETAPLFDTARFAAHLEAAYVAMFERSRAGLPPEHIDIDLGGRR